MTRITRHRSFDAPAAVVWAVVTDPDVYAAVAPNLTSVEILEGEGEGMVRRCVDADGNAWTEVCHTWEEGRGFAVAVDVGTSEFHRRLFSRFEGEWRLAERPDDVRVTVRFDFDARYGPLGWVVGRYLAYRAPPMVEAILDGWATEIDARRDGPNPPADGHRPRERERHAA
jgi:ribosome-associated toxin RatA of RatAB toxin-antitoxin module